MTHSGFRDIPAPNALIALEPTAWRNGTRLEINGSLSNPRLFCGQVAGSIQQAGGDEELVRKYRFNSGEQILTQSRFHDIG